VSAVHTHNYLIPRVGFLLRLKLDTVGKNALSLRVFYTKARISLVAPEPSQLLSYSPVQLEEMNGECKPDRS